MALALATTLTACDARAPDQAPVAPSAPPSNEAMLVPDPLVGDPSPSRHRTYVRLEAGDVLRAAPSPDAPAVEVVDEDGLTPIAAWQPPWYAVATDDGRGWIRFEAREIKDRYVSVGSGANGPRDGRPIDPAAEDLARQVLGDDRVGESCGPYGLLTDVEDPTLLTACATLADAIDREYRRRFGVTPRGAPEATVILFARRADLRSFAEQTGGTGAGYAAYTRASRGYLAMHAQADRDEVLRTLTHELTHLVHRRAIGDLPRWLSEGLADAIGDSAHRDGFLPLEGIHGAEGQARRLRGAYDVGRAPSLARLVAQPDSDFDRGTVSFDYEASALVVRYLLTEPTLAPRMRAFLAEVAEGAPPTAGRLAERLGIDWHTLEADFERWLRRQG